EGSYGSGAPGSYAHSRTGGGTGGGGGPADAVPGPRAPEPPAPPSRFSFSVGTAVEPGERGRGRRMSCTVALAVAGAVAAATVGAAFLFDLMPGDSGHKRDAASGSPSRTATPPPDSTPGGTGGPGVPQLPRAFLGTWKGPMTESTTGQPHGDLTAVFTAGGTGKDVLRTSSRISVLGTTVECLGVGRLVSGTDRSVTVEERTDPERRGTAGLCTGGTAILVFTRNADGTLRYESKETGAGKPYATLVKQTG
ncbi:serine/threonine protein kinase, partial [Streptomyces sp. YS-3]